MVSTTIASVMELFGKLKAPLTAKLVVVALVEEALVAKKFVVVMLVAIKSVMVTVKNRDEVANKFVEVTFVI